MGKAKNRHCISSRLEKMDVIIRSGRVSTAEMLRQEGGQGGVSSNGRFLATAVMGNNKPGA